MINMPNRADVAMRLRTLKFRFPHDVFSVFLPLGVFGFNFVRDSLRNLFVMIELHCV